MKQTLLLLLMLALTTAASGCADIQECTISQRNRIWSWNAWHGSKRAYRNPNVPRHVFHHFGKGWREGYYSVAQSGGPGKLPLIPPECYWGAHYQNPMGHDEIKAWFDGYQDGATAAEADGVGFWVQIPTSKGLKFQTEVLGESGPGMEIPADGHPQMEQVLPGSPLEGFPPVEELPPSKASLLPTQTEETGKPIKQN